MNGSWWLVWFVWAINSMVLQSIQTVDNVLSSSGSRRLLGWQQMCSVCNHLTEMLSLGFVPCGSCQDWGWQLTAFVLAVSPEMTLKHFLKLLYRFALDLCAQILATIQKKAPGVINLWMLTGPYGQTQCSWCSWIHYSWLCVINSLVTHQWQQIRAKMNEKGCK